jgi:hypothetical protein
VTRCCEQALLSTWISAPILSSSLQPSWLCQEVAVPEVDRWWLIYVALVAGGALGWFAQVNIFDGLIPMLVGRMDLKPETVKPETGVLPVLIEGQSDAK